VALTCVACGTAFRVSPSVAERGRRFCSAACQGQARRRRVERTCETCGKTFEVRESRLARGEVRYCSHKCQGKAISRRDTRSCKHCGTAFPTPPPAALRRGWGKFCSRACSYASQRRSPELVACIQCGREHERRNRPGVGPFCSAACALQSRRRRVERACQACGKAFEIIAAVGAKGGGRYCSRSCADQSKRVGKVLACARCGKAFWAGAFQAAHGRRFCSRTCWRGEGEKRVPVACKRCGKVFELYASLVARGRKHCSPQCAGRRRARKRRSCRQCGASFLIEAWETQHFCTPACFYAAHLPRRRRRDEEREQQIARIMELHDAGWLAPDIINTLRQERPEWGAYTPTAIRSIIHREKAKRATVKQRRRQATRATRD
jgi:endogenous inhibitor of DNA gyrase (YacG/DUF329 family)